MGPRSATSSCKGSQSQSLSLGSGRCGQGPELTDFSLARSSLALREKSKLCAPVRGSRQWLFWPASARALESADLVAVTSRKLGLPLRRGEDQNRPPSTPLLAVGFARALQSTEFTVNSVTNGNSQRGRGKGQDFGASIPVLAYPSPPGSFRPPFSKGVVRAFLVKGLPTSLWNVPENTNR